MFQYQFVAKAGLFQKACAQYNRYSPIVLFYFTCAIDWFGLKAMWPRPMAFAPGIIGIGGTLSSGFIICILPATVSLATLVQVAKVSAWLFDATAFYIGRIHMRK